MHCFWIYNIIPACHGILPAVVLSKKCYYFTMYEHMSNVRGPQHEGSNEFSGALDALAWFDTVEFTAVYHCLLSTFYGASFLNKTTAVQIPFTSRMCKTILFVWCAWSSLTIWLMIEGQIEGRSSLGMGSKFQKALFAWSWSKETKKEVLLF